MDIEKGFVFLSLDNGMVYICIPDEQFDSYYQANHNGKIELIGDSIAGMPADLPSEVKEFFRGE